MSEKQLDVARIVCRLDAIADPGARSFTMGSGDWPLRGFVVRRNGQVFGYANRCPHAGHPLNLFPNEFLTQDRSLLLCRSHGALFEISSGLCVAGPCAGAMLRAIPVVVEDDYVMVGDDPDALAMKLN